MKVLGLVPARGGSTTGAAQEPRRARRPDARPPRARDRGRRRLLRDGRALEPKTTRSSPRRTGSTWSRCGGPPELSTETARARDFARHAFAGARRVRRARDRPVHLAVHRAGGRPRRGRAARAHRRRVGRDRLGRRRRAPPAEAEAPRRRPAAAVPRGRPADAVARARAAVGAKRLGLRLPSRRRLERGLEADDVRGYEMPPERSFDIDTAEDLAFARVPRRARRALVIPRVFHQIWLGEKPFPVRRERADVAAPPPGLGAPAVDGGRSAGRPAAAPKRRTSSASRPSARTSSGSSFSTATAASTSTPTSSACGRSTRCWTA